MSQSRGRETPKIGVVAGSTGVGKSTAFRQVAARHGRVWYCEMMRGEGRSVSSMLRAIGRCVDIYSRGRSADDFSRAIVDKIAGSGGLLIVDEAQHLRGSPDYLLAIFRLGRERGLSDDEFRALAIGYGHHPLWNIMTMDGRVFQALVGHLRGLGCEMPELRRTWMTQARGAVLRRLQRARGLSDATLASILRDLGGGVFRPADLDETGFDRVIVALEGSGGHS